MKISEITSALTRLWSSLEGTSKMRASLFNLLVVTPKNDRSEYVRQITLKVLQRFPSRVIAISLDPNLPPGQIEAHVSLIPGARGEVDIVCDYISLEVSPQSLDKIPFVILPHLLPDLPIYLLWADHPATFVSHEFEKWITRVIFDSEVAENLSSFATTLLHYHQKNGSDIADLSWARTENWRELLSSTFYSPERLATLQGASKIEITYNAFETPSFCHTKIQSLYLQAWLASQLGWKLASAKPDHFTYQHGLEMILKPAHNAKLTPGTVISLDILTPTDLHFSFARDPLHPHQIRTLICDVEKCEIPSKYIFTKSQTGLSLVNEIYHTGTSSHFLKVLDFLKNWDPTCLL